MKRLYSAANLPEAHLLCGLLATRGIAARVLNEYALGALGELPPTAVHPEVWIEDERDLGLARQLIAAWERDRNRAGSRRCPGCGEENPAAFEVCWNCRKPL
jgi:hypothetical protein